MKQNKKKHLWMGIWFLLAFLLWTTLLVLSVMPTLVFQVNRRCERKTVKRTVSIFVVLFSAFMVIGRYTAFLCHALDVFSALLLFIPDFGNGEGEQSASLFEMSGTQLWIRIVFAVVISLTVLNGVCGLIISRFDKPLWSKHRFVTGIALSVIACLLFIITRQLYASVFCFAILMIKGWLLLRRKS